MEEINLLGERRAVIIGINNYYDGNINKLEGAENDANEIYELLTKYGSFKIEHKLIGSNATCSSIRKSLSDLFWKPETTANIAMFYFSGHGFKDIYKKLYIAPWDISLDEPFVHGISVDEIIEIFSKSRPLSSILILDTCYSGIDIIGQRGGNKDLQVISAKQNVEQITNLDKVEAKGKIILTSTSFDKKASEITNSCPLDRNSNITHQHGIFSYYLIDGLSGKSAKEQPGIVRLDELNTYIQLKMKEGNYEQIPEMSMSHGTNVHDIILAIASEESKRATSELIDKMKKTIKLTENNRISDIFTFSMSLKDIKNYKYDPSYKNEVEELNSALQQRLEYISSHVRIWYQNNKKFIIPKITEFNNENKNNEARYDLVRLLAFLHNNLTYDKLVNVDNISLNLLDAVFTQMDSEINNMKDFVQICMDNLVEMGTSEAESSRIGDDK